jgi:hypothetical protein
MIFSSYRDTEIYPAVGEVPAPFLFTIISDHYLLSFIQSLIKKGKDQGIFVTHNAFS